MSPIRSLLPYIPYIFTEFATAKVLRFHSQKVAKPLSCSMRFRDFQSVQLVYKDILTIAQWNTIRKI